MKETVTPYYKAGMGSGFNFSNVDDPVKTLKQLNKIAVDIDKETKRPVACMGNIRVDHYKILEFVNCKRKEDFF